MYRQVQEAKPKRDSSYSPVSHYQSDTRSGSSTTSTGRSTATGSRSSRASSVLTDAGSQDSISVTIKPTPSKETPASSTGKRSSPPTGYTQAPEVKAQYRVSYQSRAVYDRPDLAPYYVGPASGGSYSVARSIPTYYQSTTDHSGWESDSSTRAVLGADAAAPRGSPLTVDTGRQTASRRSPEKKSKSVSPASSNGSVSSQRRSSNRDEFDGPAQFLDRPYTEAPPNREAELLHLPISLHTHEQELIFNHLDERLSQCAFDFVAKYQFPIPLDPDRRPVRTPQDREWAEWAYLLKRLATKRRVPARVVYNGQIKQFTAVLDNALDLRAAGKDQPRQLKDDRNVLQMISAGIQVAKMVMDAPAMEFLDSLYVSTERLIQRRRNQKPVFVWE